MKLSITAKIVEVGAIEATKKENGFTQVIVIEQPETKDEYQRVTQHAQIFQVHGFSKERAGKLLDSSAVGQVKTFNLWLKGEKVVNKEGKTFYFLKLKLL